MTDGKDKPIPSASELMLKQKAIQVLAESNAKQEEEADRLSALMEEEPKRSLRVYLAAPFRGPDGDSASDDQIEENCKFARQVADKIEWFFPSVTMFVPHDNHAIQFYNMGWRMGYCTSDEILCKCVEKMLTCDCAVFVGTMSEGMRFELEQAGNHELPALEIEWEDPHVFEQLAEFFNEVKEGL